MLVHARIDTPHSGRLRRLWQAEDRHFWFIGRREIIKEVLEQAAPLAGKRMLEVGCGSGNVLRYLAQRTRLSMTGGDLIPEALDYCRRKQSVPLVLLDARHLPFAGCFDIVGLFDVLEHVEDDLQVLRESRAALAAQGQMVLTVPARPELGSSYDEFSGHRRRYDRRGLVAKLTEAGFTVTRASYFMAFAAPVLYLWRHVGDKLGGRTAWVPDGHLAELRIVPLINEIALALVRFEKILLRHADLPYGASLLVIARKS